MDKENEYLQKVEEVIKQGPYKDNWQSLYDYPVPKWYQDAKFGIFIHWGAYSVPSFGSEWYPRHMYIKGTKEYEHHIKTYGKHKDFGYADIIKSFKGENFDADKWIDVFKKAGAKFIMPVAEHHDGFQMYDSDLSQWCASKMGPKRDVLAELKASAEKEDLVFCASSHRAENFWFFAGATTFDSGITGKGMVEPYGFREESYNGKVEQGKISHNIESIQPTKEHLDNWLARTCELVDKYKPKVVWFDWWIHNLGFKPYLKKFAAYYYNRAKQWGEEVAINYKYEAFAYSTAVFDVERGQLAAIRPRFWQTDTAIAKNSWGYTENNNFKDPVDIVCDLIDIVSKNGAMLLNIGPKPDGTFTDEDTKILLEIGKWLEVNGESIYNTTYWQVFGEGPTQIVEGSFKDVDRDKFTSKDIRYTFKAPYLYANVLSWNETGEIDMMSLGKEKFNAFIKSVEVLGFNNEVEFTHTNEKLSVKVKGEISTKYPVCLKIKID